MDSVAISSKEDRQALFGETGAALGVANTIAEKDFWVCWTLKRLFELLTEDVPTLVFKGGTSFPKPLMRSAASPKISICRSTGPTSDTLATATRNSPT
jgi:hypothetical protein